MSGSPTSNLLTLNKSLGLCSSQTTPSASPRPPNWTLACTPVLPPLSWMKLQPLLHLLSKVIIVCTHSGNNSHVFCLCVNPILIFLFIPSFCLPYHQFQTQGSSVLKHKYKYTPDVPNPPQILEVTCNDRDASVAWQPMGENRAPILGYLIQYNTSFTPDTWENAFESVPAASTQFNVSDLFVYGSSVQGIHMHRI